MTRSHPRRALVILVVSAIALAACAEDSSTQPSPSPTQPLQGQTLTVYSGRSEELVGEVFDRFEAATGITVAVRYAGTSELAATLLEEGDRSPADLFWAQDAGALGAIAKAGLFADLPADVLDRVDVRFRSPGGLWVGITGRVRTVVYNTDALDETRVVASVFDLTDPAWAGKVGWAPTNGSFQAFVTAMRRLRGDEATRTWVEDMLANGVREYPNNTAIVEAVGRGEIELGLANHYYLFRFTDEDPGFPAANAFLEEDVGGLVNVAGAGIIASSVKQELAAQLLAFLLSDEIQTYFGSERSELEYPLAVDVDADPALPPLASLDPPDVDLSDLDDLEGTLALLTEAGALE